MKRGEINEKNNTRVKSILENQAMKFVEVYCVQQLANSPKLLIDLHIKVIIFLQCKPG